MTTFEEMHRAPDAARTALTRAEERLTFAREQCAPIEAKLAATTAGLASAKRELDVAKDTFMHLQSEQIEAARELDVTATLDAVALARNRVTDLERLVADLESEITRLSPEHDALSTPVRTAYRAVAVATRDLARAELHIATYAIRPAIARIMNSKPIVEARAEYDKAQDALDERFDVARMSQYDLAFGPELPRELPADDRPLMVFIARQNTYFCAPGRSRVFKEIGERVEAHEEDLSGDANWCTEAQWEREVAEARMIAGLDESAEPVKAVMAARARQHDQKHRAAALSSQRLIETHYSQAEVGRQPLPVSPEGVKEFQSRVQPPRSPSPGPIGVPSGGLDAHRSGMVPR